MAKKEEKYFISVVVWEDTHELAGMDHTRKKTSPFNNLSGKSALAVVL